MVLKPSQGLALATVFTTNRLIQRFLFGPGRARTDGRNTDLAVPLDNWCAGLAQCRCTRSVACAFFVSLLLVKISASRLDRVDFHAWNP